MFQNIVIALSIIGKHRSCKAGWVRVGCVGRISDGIEQINKQTLGLEMNIQ